MTTMIMFDRYMIDSVLYNTIHLQHDLSYWTSTIVLYRCSPVYTQRHNNSYIGDWPCRHWTSSKSFRLWSGDFCDFANYVVKFLVKNGIFEIRRIYQTERLFVRQSIMDNGSQREHFIS